MTERNEFIANVAMRICRTLDIEEAIADTFAYMKNFFPLDELFIDVYNENIHGMQRFCGVDDNGSLNDQRILPLPAEVSKNLTHVKEDVFILGSEDNRYFSKEVSYALGVSGCSAAVIRLKNNKDIIGYLVMKAAGRDRYSDSHLELIKNLKNPFSMAMINAVTYKSVLNDKERLLDLDSARIITSSFGHPESLIGAGSGLKDVVKLAAHVAKSRTTVLITGETGVGKELIANMIHDNSEYSGGPFIKVNCGAIPETLIDSELFGHDKGAYTSADSAQKGRFERANRGTIFLDEIGELPLSVQTRLLRVLQFKVVERLGGSKPVQVDVRVIAATNKNLEEMVKEGTFREDLWYRLNVFPIEVPPLRKRKQDIPELVWYLIKKKCLVMGVKHIPDVPDVVMKKICDYDWPGNVREMENVVEREVILNSATGLKFNCLNAIVYGEQAAKIMPQMPSDLRLDSVINDHIKKVMTITNGKISGPGGAAEMMDIHPNTLRHRMKKLGLL